MFHCTDDNLNDNMINIIINNNEYDNFISNFNQNNISFIKVSKLYKYFIGFALQETYEFNVYIYKDDIKKINKNRLIINNVWNELINDCLNNGGKVFASNEFFYNYYEYHDFITNHLYNNQEIIKSKIIQEYIDNINN
jgi:hypothetical protein